jgi:hypothetical protein
MPTQLHCIICDDGLGNVSLARWIVAVWKVGFFLNWKVIEVT